MSSFLSVIKKVIGITKKIFLVVAVYFLIISLFMYFINKDKPKITYDPIQKNRQEIYKLINDKKLNSTKEGKLTITIYRAMTCGFIGEACTDNPDDGDKNYQKSIFGFMGNLIALPYANPPASGVYWAYSGLQNAGFIPKTYAAEGIGFAAIKPFMNLWKVFRDIAYMLLVLVLIAIGFMIMFRMKLNPQTVISVENSLPRIVISLLLITFSFAIAGFLIDLMYVLILITIAIMGDRGNFFIITEFQNKYIDANFGTITNGLFPLGFFPTIWQLANSLIVLLPFIINQILRAMLGIAGFIAIDKWFSATEKGGKILESISELAGNLPVGETVAAIFEIASKELIFFLIGSIGFFLGYLSLPIVISILVFFTFIFMIFRIFFLLFATYIRIFLMIIFSPLFMLVEAIPGKNAFGYWLKTLFVEILAFPIVIILFVISYLIINVLPTTGNLWQPPFLTQLDPAAFTVVLAIGILFLIPDLVKMVRELLGVKQLPIGLSLGTFFSGVGAGYSGTMAGLQQFSGLANFPAIGDLMGKIPGVRTLKAHLIPPSQQQIAKQQAKATLMGMGKEGKELEEILENAFPTSPVKKQGS